MKVEKRKNFLINFCYLAILLGLIYIGVKYLVPAILPIVLALLIAVILKGPIGKISRSKNISRGLTSVMLLIVFYAFFTILIILLVSQLLSLIQSGITVVPDVYLDKIEPIFNKIAEDILVMFPEIASDVEGVTRYITNSISTFINNASTSIVAGIGTLVAKIPSLLVNALFTLIASFFFTIYYHDITNFIFRQLPKDMAIRSRELKGSVIGTILDYVKSYAILMLVTFIELSIGIIILGIDNPLAVSAIISIVDILPVLGVGTVLIPWSIIGFVSNNFKIGIGMLVLYGIITIVRQSLEPRIIGQQIGLHPVVTLVSIYVGGQLFGLLGVFLLPITIVMIKKLHDDGTLNWFK